MPKNDKNIRAREDTTIDEARHQGIGKAEDGEVMDVPSVADPRGVSDLGVEEPIVPEPLREETSPEDGEQETR